MFKNILRFNRKKSINLVLRNEYFTEFEIKIGRFNKFKKDMNTKNINLEENKRKINQILIDNFQPATLYELLNPLIYLGKSDDDIKIILTCIERMKDIGATEYKIHASFMRLLYTLNKIELAIDYFKNDKLRSIFMQDLVSSMIILDKLIEDKKYNEAIKFFNLNLINLKKIPSSILNAITFCLLKINSKESYSEMKNLVDIVKKKNLMFGLNSIVQIFMFAIQQNDYLYGLNFLTRTSRINITVYNNLIAIGYSCLDQPNEALLYLKSLLNDKKKEDHVFITTLNYLEKAVERSNDGKLKNIFETLKNEFSESKKIKNIDIVDYYSQSTEGVYSKTLKKFND